MAISPAVRPYKALAILLRLASAEAFSFSSQLGVEIFNLLRHSHFIGLLDAAKVRCQRNGVWVIGEGIAEVVPPIDEDLLRFTEALGRRLARGQRFAKEISEEILPKARDETS